MSLIKPVDMQKVADSNEYMGVYRPPKIEQTDVFELDIQKHFDLINEKSYFPKYKVEEILLRQQQYELWRMEKGNRFTVPEGLVKFTPSSASKAKRDLFYKALKVKPDESTNAPFNNRWTRNSTAIHGTVQRDLLYGNHMFKEPLFTVNMVDKGEFGLLPAWEKNIEAYKIIEHKGVKFVVSGMMDGILKHTLVKQLVLSLKLKLMMQCKLPK